MATEDPIVVVGMARTPMGGLLGELSALSANELGAEAVKAALAEAGVAGEDVDLIYMGNVLGAGQGQAPARQAAIKAGLPKSVEATTLNKMCGSGMQAAIMGRASRPFLHCGGRCERRGRRRHGIHDQRPAPPAQSPHRL